MEGLGMSIAALSVNMSMQSAATTFSMKMLDNVLETNENAGMQMVESLNEMAMPNGVGSLLDIRA